MRVLYERDREHRFRSAQASRRVESREHER